MVVGVEQVEAFGRGDVSEYGRDVVDGYWVYRWDGVQGRASCEWGCGAGAGMGLVGVGLVRCVVWVNRWYCGADVAGGIFVGVVEDIFIKIENKFCHIENNV